MSIIGPPPVPINITSPTAGTAGIERGENIEFEPSATKDCIVILQIRPKENTQATIEIFVNKEKLLGAGGGAPMGAQTAAGGSSMMFTFPVAKGVKWEYKTGGKVEKGLSTYIFID